MNEDVRQNASFCGISGLLMLAFAYFYRGLGPASEIDAGVYIMSFGLFKLTLAAGGTLLLVIAGLSAAGIGVAALMESVVSSLSGLLLAAVAVCWTVSEMQFDLFNVLVLVFGLLMAQSGIRGLASYVGRPSRQAVGGAAGRPASGGLFGTTVSGPPKPAAPKPVHPASLSSSALPKDGEAAPDEGYLAALSKEQDEPSKDRDA